MIALEVEDGITKPVVICDHCDARIIGSGNVLWIMPPIPDGLAIGDRFRVEPLFFHVHKRCHRPFEASYRERHGRTRFMWTELWEHLTQTLNNAVVQGDNQAHRIYSAVQKVVESERNPEAP